MRDQQTRNNTIETLTYVVPASDHVYTFLVKTDLQGAFETACHHTAKHYTLS